MRRDGTQTRERLLDAAQYLFARQGVDAVPIREINERAGQRNASALHYHFGSRLGLLRAVAERHQPAIDDERQRRLARVGGDPEDVVAAMFKPLTEQLRTADGRDYLRITPELLRAGHAVDLPARAGLLEAIDRLEHHLTDVPRRIRRERIRCMIVAMTTLLADRAARIESEGRAALGHDVFVKELIIMATGQVLGPPPTAAANGRRTTRA